jgi:NAD(P)-dependent dehydrogenase (short-subunit alcohol dehydrogenase family)
MAARVLVTGRSQAGLESAQRKLGAGAIVVSSDTGSLTDIDALASRVKTEFDTFDLLYAGFSFPAPLESAVSPGLTDTPIIEKRFGEAAAQMKEQMKGMVPAKRWGTTEESPRPSSSSRSTRPSRPAPNCLSTAVGRTRIEGDSSERKLSATGQMPVQCGRAMRGWRALGLSFSVECAKPCVIA